MSCECTNESEPQARSAAAKSNQLQILMRWSRHHQHEFVRRWLEPGDDRHVRLTAPRTSAKSDGASSLRPSFCLHGNHRSTPPLSRFAILGSILTKAVQTLVWHADSATKEPIMDRDRRYVCSHSGHIERRATVKWSSCDISEI
jgi:hypothetical protein